MRSVLIAGGGNDALVVVEAVEVQCDQKGACKATWKREFKLPWRESGSPDHHDDTVDSDQLVVNDDLSL